MYYKKLVLSASTTFQSPQRHLLPTLSTVVLQVTHTPDGKYILIVPLRARRESIDDLRFCDYAPVLNRHPLTLRREETHFSPVTLTPSTATMSTANASWRNFIVKCQL